jgi:hypothetical protein
MQSHGANNNMTSLAHDQTQSAAHSQLQPRKYLNEKQAADFLGISPKTLSRWRWAGKQPAFCKFGGAVRYRLDDLETFAERSRQEVPAA